MQADDIIVTATRSPTTIRKAPLAISSLGAEALQEQHLVSVADLSNRLPSLQIGTSTTETRIFIRGIGNNNLIGGIEPGVALLADGVYIGTSGTASNAFFDIARIEVARGPQGTLFGRNATGGSVNLITAAPTREFEGQVSGTIGVDPLQTIVQGHLSGSLSSDGALTGRISATVNYNKGYTKNLADVGPRTFDDDKSFGIRGQLRYSPNDAVSSRLIVEYRRSDSTGQAQIMAGIPPSTVPPAIALGGRFNELGKREVYANVGSRKGSYLFATLDNSFDVGPGTLKWLASVGRTTTNILQDGDTTDFYFYNNDLTVRAKQLYSEMLYDVSPLQGLHVILGANYYRQNSKNETIVPAIFLPDPVVIQADLKTRSVGVFAHARYNVTTGIALFGGLRQTWDKKSIDESNNFVGSQSQSDRFPKLTYEVGASADLSDAVSSYVKYSTGFKAGGYGVGSVTPAVEPEINKTVEVGLKGSFLDRALQINIAAYSSKYSDLQVVQLLGFSATLKNAAEAHNKGIEVEAQVRPVARLRFDVSGAYQDAEFDEFLTTDPANPGLGVQNLKGNPLPATPKFTYNVGATYTLPIGDNELSLTGRYYHSSRIFFTEFRDVSLGSQAPVGRVDLSATLETADRRSSLSIFVRNLTNEVVYGSLFKQTPAFGGTSAAELEPGRFIGATVMRKF